MASTAKSAASAAQTPGQSGLGLSLAGAFELHGALALALGKLRGLGGAHAVEYAAPGLGLSRGGFLYGPGVFPLQLAHALAGALKALLRAALRSSSCAALSRSERPRALSEQRSSSARARSRSATVPATRRSVSSPEAISGLQLGYGPAAVIAPLPHPGAQPLGGLAGGDLLLAGGDDAGYAPLELGGARDSRRALAYEGARAEDGAARAGEVFARVAPVDARHGVRGAGVGRGEDAHGRVRGPCGAARG